MHVASRLRLGLSPRCPVLPHPVGEQPALLFAAAGLVVLVATLEEFLLMWLLPEWTADLRGVYWILTQRRETGTEKANPG